ncbi:IS66 family transposase [Pseudovibrio denitrificans]|uniref:IS66 family transposase n=1 Tax=Pseudovibrio denitrificans TaxID=258256 RepID=UPI0039BEDD8A
MPCPGLVADPTDEAVKVSLGHVGCGVFVEPVDIYPQRGGELWSIGKNIKKFKGILQADAYAGYRQFYAIGRIKEISYWAHRRRDSYDTLTPTETDLT